MILWEWRRLYRQKIRQLVPKNRYNYKDLGHKKLAISFVLFFVGWKILGLVIHDKIVYRWDENLGDFRYFEVKEVKEILKKNQKEASKKEDLKSKTGKDEITLPKAFILDTDD
ncbi:Hypothetical protein SRAE_1000330800 [Strongyloides ratti]|uniref:Uncharacterized protein n=1 Tax=Strongyloides ratti TaxID=34506 RepID=A0A090LBZ0_STRRB|nr:Hypothetical protein SRAE_1000330800 [Strongyloides ratti]CEF65055.1 Hypothetical protein SRAE_1000330800 [Strongyloides ratti]